MGLHEVLHSAAQARLLIGRLTPARTLQLIEALAAARADLGIANRKLAEMRLQATVLEEQVGGAMRGAGAVVAGAVVAGAGAPARLRRPSFDPV